MNKHERHREKYITFYVPENTKNTGLGRKESIFQRGLQDFNVMHFMAGLCQILLGSVVIIVAAFGFARSVWISTLICILASIVILSGVWFCYTAVSSLSRDTLLKQAMRRVMEAQN